MQAAKTDYCRCCKKVILGKNHYISLFGEKAVEEGIVEAVRKYGNINVVEEDIGVVSTKICRACYSLVRGIMEKIEKFSNICKASCSDKDSLAENLEMKRSIAERSPSQVAVSPSVLQQVKRSRHLPDDQAPHTRAKVSLFQSRPILPKPDHSENTTHANTEVIYFILSIIIMVCETDFVLIVPFHLQNTISSFPQRGKILSNSPSVVNKKCKMPWLRLLSDQCLIFHVILHKDLKVTLM